MKTKRSFSYALISSLLVLSALQGCGDDDSGANPTPPDVTPTAGKKATGGSGGSNNTGGSGNKAGTQATPEGGGGAGDGGAPATVTPVGGQAGEGGEGPVEPACDPLLGADGCFNCPKDGEVAQWLNRCVDSDCEPFANATRLPLLKADGSLPALPN